MFNPSPSSPYSNGGGIGNGTVFPLVSRRDSKMMKGSMNETSPPISSEFLDTSKSLFKRRFKTQSDEPPPLRRTSIKKEQIISVESLDIYGSMQALPQTAKNMSNEVKTREDFLKTMSIDNSSSTPLRVRTKKNRLASSSLHETIPKPQPQPQQIHFPPQSSRQAIQHKNRSESMMRLRHLNKQQLSSFDFFDPHRTEAVEQSSPNKLKSVKSTQYLEQLGAEMACYTRQMNDDFSGNQNTKMVGEKLRKVTKQLLNAGRLINLKPSLSTKQYVHEILEQKEFKKDMDMYMREQETRNDAKESAHVIFMQEFCYKFQEFLIFTNSLNRAESLIQQIAGFTQLVKKLLFVDGHLRLEISMPLLEELIAEWQVKTKTKHKRGEGSLTHQNNLGVTTRQRRIGGLSKMNEESENPDLVAELEYFSKNLATWVDEKSKMKVKEMDSDAANEFSAIKKILNKHTSVGNFSEKRFRESCFREVKTYADDNEKDDGSGTSPRAPNFTQPNQTFKNLDYWEKRLGKFTFISKHVRQKDADIALLCKNYMAL